MMHYRHSQSSISTFRFVSPFRAKRFFLCENKEVSNAMHLLSARVCTRSEAVSGSRNEIATRKNVNNSPFSKSRLVTWRRRIKSCALLTGRVITARLSYQLIYESLLFFAIAFSRFSFRVWQFEPVLNHPRGENINKHWFSSRDTDFNRERCLDDGDHVSFRFEFSLARCEIFYGIAAAAEWWTSNWKWFLSRRRSFFFLLLLLLKINGIIYCQDTQCSARVCSSLEITNLIYDENVNPLWWQPRKVPRKKENCEAQVNYLSGKLVGRVVNLIHDC